MSRIAFLGNFQVPFSSESHHAKTLEKMGHTVIRLQEAECSAETVLDWAKGCDMLVWIHTHGWQTPGEMSMADVLKELKILNIPTVTYHLDLWMGLARQKDLEQDEFYRHIGHFFTVDRLMADWFNKNTEVKGHYLRAGVFEDECVQLPSTEPFADIVFVGSKGYHPEWPWRPQLVNWLQETYGDRFKHVGPDGLGIVRGMELNQLLANTKLVVGDSLCPNFDYPDYWSDRPYEIVGRGGFIVMPFIQGIRDEFPEMSTFNFGDLEGLKNNIDLFLGDDISRLRIKNALFERVKTNYTYTHRWATIMKELGL